METKDIESVSGRYVCSWCSWHLCIVCILGGHHVLEEAISNHIKCRPRQQSYNKVEKDFPTLLEYNNYLEEVEDISEFGLLVVCLYVKNSFFILYSAL